MWHNQGSEVPQQLPGKTIEVVTYNVNLEIWTTTQRETEKVSLHMFSAYNLNKKDGPKGLSLELISYSPQNIPVLHFRDQIGLGLWNWFGFFTTGMLPSDNKMLER